MVPRKRNAIVLITLGALLLGLLPMFLCARRSARARHLVAACEGELWFAARSKRRRLSPAATMFRAAVSDPVLIVIGAPKTEADIQAASSFSACEQLALNAGDLSDADLTPLARMDSLRVLSIESGDRVNGSFLRPPTNVRNLEVLNLAGSAFCDTSVELLRRAHELSTLDLRGTAITDIGGMGLRELRSLEVLRLRGTAVADSSVKVISRLREIRELDLSYTGATARATGDLTAMPKLAVLWLLGLPLDSDGIAALGRCQALSRLYCRIPPELLPEALFMLKRVSTLTFVAIETEEPEADTMRAYSDGLDCEVSWWDVVQND